MNAGDVGRVRDYILVNNAKTFRLYHYLVSYLFHIHLQRQVLSITKRLVSDTTFFYVIKNVGHTLSARKKSTPKNDLPKMLDAFKGEKSSPEIESYIVDNSVIKENGNSLWVYDYFEVVPDSPLSDGVFS